MRVLQRVTDNAGGPTRGTRRAVGVTIPLCAAVVTVAAGLLNVIAWIQDGIGQGGLARVESVIWQRALAGQRRLAWLEALLRLVWCPRLEWHLVLRHRWRRGQPQRPHQDLQAGHG